MMSPVSPQWKARFVGPHLLVFVVGLLRLHRLLRLISFMHFNQGGAGHTENAVDVDPHFDLHLGTLTRRLRDDFLDKELACGGGGCDYMSSAYKN